MKNITAQQTGRTYKTILGRILAAVLSLLLIVTILLPQAGMQDCIKTMAATHTLSNPTKDASGNVTWDCVWFGNYWQSDAKGKTKEPIKWRVLCVNGNDAFLLADKNLDGGIPYNEERTSVTWEICTMRSWLNSTFMNNAFSAAERNAIKETLVVNNDNPGYGTEGGNDTKDKLYLLSIEEAINPQYGFTDSTGSTVTREAINTAYTASKSGMYSMGRSDWWWLRSPGNDTNRTAYVYRHGCLSRYGKNVDYSNYAVRPALHLNLSSSSLYSYAGTVCSGVTAPGEVKGVLLTKAGSGKLKVSYKKIKDAQGYQISYSTDKYFTNVKNFTTKDNKYTIKKLKKGKTYYVRVRAYRLDGSKKVYGKWSVVKKKKIK